MTAQSRAGHGSDHDVHGRARIVERTLLVSLARARSFGRATRAGAALSSARAAACPRAEIHLELSRAHCYFADIVQEREI